MRAQKVSGLDIGRSSDTPVPPVQTALRLQVTSESDGSRTSTGYRAHNTCIINLSRASTWYILYTK